MVRNENLTRDKLTRLDFNVQYYNKAHGWMVHKRGTHTSSDISVQEQMASVSAEGLEEDKYVDRRIFQLLNDSSVQEKQVFSFMIRNLAKGIPDDAIEAFVFRLISKNQCKAVGSLLLAVSHQRRVNLSDELWSIYLSCVCDNACNTGAMVIYHEIIDPKEAYGELPFRDQNSLTPFLVTPSTLENLALIFQQNGDPARLEGVLAYFKRFYSYLHHRDIYKSLKITLVEAYSQAGDSEGALKAFKDLCFCFTGDAYSHKRSREIRTLNIFSANNFRWRRENIKHNNKLENAFSHDSNDNFANIQREILSQAGSSIYDPLVEYNVYSSPGSKQLPILDRQIQVKDLPCFSSLINENIGSITHFSVSELVTNLTASIKKCHYMLHLFVVANLSCSGYIREAYNVIIKLPDSYPNMKPKEVVKHENFIYLLMGCKNMLVKAKRNDDEDEMKQLFLLCIDIKNHFLSLPNHGPEVNKKVISYFISAILSSPFLTKDRMGTFLDEYVELMSKKPKSRIVLDENDYQAFVTLMNIKNSKGSKFDTIIREQIF